MHSTYACYCRKAYWLLVYGEKLILNDVDSFFSLKDIYHERAWLKSDIFSVQVTNFIISLYTKLLNCIKMTAEIRIIKFLPISGLLYTYYLVY